MERHQKLKDRTSVPTGEEKRTKKGNGPVESIWSTFKDRDGVKQTISQLIRAENTPELEFPTTLKKIPK